MVKQLMILAGCLSFATAVAVCTTGFGSQKNGPPRTPGNVGRYEPRQVLRKPIRPITDPRIVASEASDVAPNELVIGVVVDSEARAYPVNMLTGPEREIINDTLAGRNIAATW